MIPNGGSVASPYNNQFYVFAYDGSDLVQQNISAVPEPASVSMLVAGLPRRRRADPPTHAHRALRPAVRLRPGLTRLPSRA